MRKDVTLQAIPPDSTLAYNIEVSVNIFPLPESIDMLLQFDIAKDDVNVPTKT